MNQPWHLIVQLGYLSVFLLMAVIIRRFLPFIKKFRIPDAIVAGFLAMIAGPSLLNIVPLDFKLLTALVYHLMAIGFIALSLKGEKRKGVVRSAISGSLYIVISYAIQGMIGLGLTLLLIHTFYPKLFPSFGFLLPFGFAQGPGLAGGMGAEWEAIKLPDGSSAFPHGASIGFSFSTIGFLWACFVGVPLMNYLVKRRKKKGEMPVIQEGEPAGILMERERDYAGISRSIDKMTTQLILVLAIYLGLRFGLTGITKLLKIFLPGSLGESMASIFWGFQFGFGALVGTIVGRLIRKLENKGFLKGRAMSNYILQHIGGTSIDFMIAASIAAIDVRVFVANMIPILIITTIGGLAVIVYTWFFVRKFWRNTYVEHFVAFFGMHTGTISTGMALLRGVDPNFKTSAATDMIYGSGIALIFGIPLIFLAGLPVHGFLSNKPQLYWITLLLCFAYALIIFIIWFSPPVSRFFTKYTKDVKRVKVESQ